MKKLAKILIEALLPLFIAASPALCQSNSFTLTGQAMGVFSGGAKLVAADAVGSYKFSNSMSARSDNIFISQGASGANLATVDLAGPMAVLPAGKLLNKIRLDSTKYDIYAGAEFGSDTTSAGVTNAESGYVGLTRHISESVDVTLFEARFLHAPIQIDNLHTEQNSFIVSLGFSFGK